MRSSTHTAM